MVDEKEPGADATSDSHQPLTIGQCATLACTLEATVPKPGNVHRGADFEDLTLTDLLVSAVAIGPVMDQAARGMPFGKTVCGAVRSTRRWVDNNTNLGIVLLMAPLARVPREVSLESGLPDVLRGLTPADARDVYEAIRLAQPGGLGRVERMDVADSPPPDLLAAMQQAAPHDLVARQYINDFDDLFSTCVPWLKEAHAAGWNLTDMLMHTQVRLMHQFPDSLIARKCGQQVAQQSADRAGRALDAGPPGPEFYAAVADLDFWLRSDGHRRNPGTTADFIAAGLFALLRDEVLAGPLNGRV